MDPDRLAELPLFASLTPDERTRVASWVDEQQVPEGTKLTAEGEFGYRLFVIEDGAAEVSIRDTVVERLGPGDVVGEIGLLVTGRRTATVTTTQPTTVATIFDAKFRLLEREVPDIADALRRVAGQRLGQSSSSSSTLSGLR
jgi:CRP-like cAMP-binding protein